MGTSNGQPDTISRNWKTARTQLLSIAPRTYMHRRLGSELLLKHGANGNGAQRQPRLHRRCHCAQPDWNCSGGGVFYPHCENGDAFITCSSNPDDPGSLTEPGSWPMAVVTFTAVAGGTDHLEFLAAYAYTYEGAALVNCHYGIGRCLGATDIKEGPTPAPTSTVTSTPTPTHTPTPTATPHCNLSISKTADSLTVPEGGTSTWTITLTNRGDNSCTPDLEVEDDIPSHTDCTDASVDPSSDVASNYVDIHGCVASGIISWNTTHDLAAGESLCARRVAQADLRRKRG